jgi:ribosomal protein S18 acetylase RimI-like enzyme
MGIENKEGMPEIKISDATLEDARGTAEVYYKTWLATYPNKEVGVTVDDIEDQFKDSFTEEGLAKQAERIAYAPENVSFFLAKDGGKVVGVCRVVRNPQNNQLKTIYVLPEYQGKGIGRLLWEEAQKHFDAGKDVIVHVATYNTGAIEFYKKLGFKETGKEFSDKKFKMKSGAIIPETELVIKAKAETQ